MAKTCQNSGMRMFFANKMLTSSNMNWSHAWPSVVLPVRPDTFQRAFWTWATMGAGEVFGSSKPRSSAPVIEQK